MSKPIKAKALDRLQLMLMRIPDLMALDFSEPDLKKWYRDTRVAISYAFGQDSDQVTEFKSIPFALIATCDCLQGAETMLKSMIEEIEAFWPEEEATMVARRGPDGINANHRKVFVIHGHDEAAMHKTARFIKLLELEPVILAEQPSEGKTIIEKFEEHADVGYAIALLTADDTGSRQGEDGARPRARQNVIFELGYFIGRLGRERVCALTKGEPEIPSDYSGVVYISMDAGDWKTEIFRELKVAHFNIDANRMFE